MTVKKFGKRFGPSMRHVALFVLILAFHVLAFWRFMAWQAESIVAVADSDRDRSVQVMLSNAPQVREKSPEKQLAKAQAEKMPPPRATSKEKAKAAVRPSASAPSAEVGKVNDALVVASSAQINTTQVSTEQSSADAPSKADPAGAIGDANAMSAGQGTLGVHSEPKLAGTSQQTPATPEKPNEAGAQPSALPAPTNPVTTALPPPVRLYSLPLASFPTASTLSFAVHIPKDYSESSSSGTALVKTESDTAQGTYGVNIDITLGWLLRRAIGGAISYQSTGKIGPNGPQPLRYSEKVGDRPERWLEVDRDKREMKSSQISGLALQPGTQDRLSAIWLLSMLARSDPEQLAKGKTFSVPMFTFRSVYMARFEGLGPEVLESPAGILQTTHVRYKGADASSDQVDVWLGYDYEMQPVRIRWQEPAGRIIDLILNKKP